MLCYPCQLAKRRKKEKEVLLNYFYGLHVLWWVTRQSWLLQILYRLDLFKIFDIWHFHGICYSLQCRSSCLFQHNCCILQGHIAAPSARVVESIAMSSAGDIRSAINALQFACRQGTLQSLLFHPLSYLFYCLCFFFLFLLLLLLQPFSSSLNKPKSVKHSVIYSVELVFEELPKCGERGDHYGAAVDKGCIWLEEVIGRTSKCRPRSKKKCSVDAIGYDVYLA